MSYKRNYILDLLGGPPYLKFVKPAASLKTTLDTSVCSHDVILNSCQGVISSLCRNRLEVSRQ